MLVAYLDEFTEESSVLQAFFNEVFAAGQSLDSVPELFDLVQKWSKKLQVCKPFGLIVNVLSNQRTQLSIAIVNPLAWIDTRLNQNERLIQETIELLERTVWLLEEYISLQLRTEDNLTTANKAQVCEPNHLRLVINQRHQLNLLL